MPYRDTGDMRTSYNLMEEGGGPRTPSKSRLIPSESDAQRGKSDLVNFRDTPPTMNDAADFLDKYLSNRTSQRDFYLYSSV